MNPTISLNRQNSNATFGSVPPSRRDRTLRMPRFFKRLFKFPQMDFEMAIWEMTSLIIAPKKVFRSIYYQVPLSLYMIGITKSHTLTAVSETYAHSSSMIITTNTNHSILTSKLRNKEYMAQTRPFIHLPALLLPSPNSSILGPRLRRRLLSNRSDNSRLHLRPLSRDLPHRLYNRLLLRRKAARTGSGRSTRQKQETRIIWTARERTCRTVGIWILFRCK